MGSFLSSLSASSPFTRRSAGSSISIPMVVDFAASWCGPCRSIEPLIHNFAAKYTDVEFVKIDVDELHDVSGEFAVNAMPTFVLLKQGKEVERVVGAKKDELEQKILKHREVPKLAS